LTNEELKQQIKELQEIIHQNGIQFKDVCKEYDDLKAVIDEIKTLTEGKITDMWKIRKLKEILKESK
jgi:hypothetical protein